MKGCTSRAARTHSSWSMWCTMRRPRCTLEGFTSSYPLLSVPARTSTVCVIELRWVSGRVPRVARSFLANPGSWRRVRVNPECSLRQWRCSACFVLLFSLFVCLFFIQPHWQSDPLFTFHSLCWGGGSVCVWCYVCKPYGQGVTRTNRSVETEGPMIAGRGT